MTTRDDVIAIAERYLFHGLVEHDPEPVPLAAGCWRREQGRNTGDSGPAIAASLRSDIMKVITGIENLSWVVEGEQAVAFYDLHVKTGDPVRIAERFRVADDEIHEIEALFTTPAG